MLLHLREDYKSNDLTINDLDVDAFGQFHNWFQNALKAGVREPNAMTLATSSPDGRPSARVVLLKDYDPDGFTFFTNYESRKGGGGLAANPNVALVFLWLDLQRQVRIEGQVEKLPREVSESYFQSRPRGSQIGAWASPQSSLLENREALEARVEAAEKKFDGLEKLPLPEFWGGYLVKPVLIEFWQGQSSRFHDRFQYTKQADGGWLIERLAP